MEELDLSSHIVKIFWHDYHLSAQKEMIEKVVCKALIWLQTMHVTLARGRTGIPAGYVMTCYMRGLP